MSSEVYYRSWMDKPHLDPNTNLLTEEYVQGIGEFMRLVQQQPDAKSDLGFWSFLFGLGRESRKTHSTAMHPLFSFWSSGSDTAPKLRQGKKLFNNASKNSSLELASMEQQKVDEEVKKLAEYQKTQKEELHEKIMTRKTKRSETSDRARDRTVERRAKREEAHGIRWRR
ncbi:hypothetical protein F2Q70_00044823 [Brassica cretica]|uniref:Uncharacterized protein n=1 Tax=Brassica cretica TaxID=69181 RepID=A0A8S9KG34_BRACR|nr:hypothetical protein F2Q70_00044823 [Brassica cretica]